MQLTELSNEELLLINGGSELSEAVCFCAGAILKAFVVFAREGGRSASICVR